MAGLDYCTVLPSWDFDKDPAHFVEYYFGQEASETGDDADDIQTSCQDLNIRNFLQLTCNETENEPCMVSLTCKPQYHASICGLHVYSQASLMEVYDTSEGYLRTVRGNKIISLEEGEGGEETEVVYKCRVKLQDTLYGLSIKFPKSQGEQTLRIYRIVFILHPEPEDDYGNHVNDLGMINMSKVKSYVTSLGNNIPDGARDLMQSMEDYQQSQRSSLSEISSSLGHQSSSRSGLGMMGLMSMLSQVGISSTRIPSTAGQPNLNIPSHVTENRQSFHSDTNATQAHSSKATSENSDSSDMYSFLHDICGKVSDLRETERKSEDSENADIPTESATEENSQLSDHVKSKEHTDNAVITVEMVDLKLKELESRILSHVDTKLAEIENRLTAKLNDIVRLLQNTATNLPESSNDM